MRNKPVVPERVVVEPLSQKPPIPLTIVAVLYMPVRLIFKSYGNNFEGRKIKHQNMNTVLLQIISLEIIF